MPILIRADPNSTLRQGDLLHGRDLYFCGAKEGQEPASPRKRASYLLVISRDCQALRDGLVAVLSVSEYKLSKPEDDFARLRKVLEVDRDGGRTPDLLYLGPIGDHGKRFVARLNLPFVIEIPESEQERGAWVVRERVATLHRDYLAHLHSRLFGVFARSGFDDHAWLADDDLDILVRRGDAEIASLDAEVKRMIADQDHAQLRGATGDIHKLEKNLPKVRARLEELLEEVAPFRDEQIARQSMAVDENSRP